MSTAKTDPPNSQSIDKRSVSKKKPSRHRASVETGTVILRNAVPKYSFERTSQNRKPEAIVSGTAKTEVAITGTAKPVQSQTSCVQNINSESKPTPQIASVTPLPAASGPISNAPASGHDSCSADGKPCFKMSLPICFDMNNLSRAMEATGCTVADHTLLEQELDIVKREKRDIKAQLDVQLKVNAELKKLLVASVGEDIEYRVEKLARDRAQLTQELGGYNVKMKEDYENFDKISIQADMWRSKFLASRVMVDELANAKAFFSMQYQESQNALQQMLNERHELRTNLLECYRSLNHVKKAFDPLNAQRSSRLQTTDVIALAQMSLLLADAIKFRLLPCTPKTGDTFDIEKQWGDKLTQAEAFAQDVLSKITVSSTLTEVIPRGLPAPTSLSIERFHPLTRFDNLTLNCCVHCKGEISVL